MNKKMLIILATLLLAAGMSWSTPTIYTSLGVGTEAQVLGATYATGDGDAYVNGDLEVDGQFYATEIMAKMDTWDNLEIKSTTTLAGAAGITISTGPLNTITTDFAETQFTQTLFPRNVAVSVDKATVNLNITCVITGLDARGNSVTETLTITSSTVVYYGRRAFSKITAMSLDSTSTNASTDLKINVGTGDWIGLLGDIDATTDVYKAVVQTSTTKADETTSVTVDATYDTWTHSDVPDGEDDYYIYYRANAE